MFVSLWLVDLYNRKEAQKCHCGTASCRGIIGGEKSQPLKNMMDKPMTAGKKKKEEKRKADYNFSDDMVSRGCV